MNKIWGSVFTLMDCNIKDWAVLSNWGTGSVIFNECIRIPISWWSTSRKASKGLQNPSVVAISFFHGGSAFSSYHWGTAIEGQTDYWMTRGIVSSSPDNHSIIFSRIVYQQTAQKDSRLTALMNRCPTHALHLLCPQQQSSPNTCSPQ